MGRVCAQDFKKRKEEHPIALLLTLMLLVGIAPRSYATEETMPETILVTLPEVTEETTPETIPEPTTEATLVTTPEAATEVSPANSIPPMSPPAFLTRLSTIPWVPAERKISRGTDKPATATPLPEVRLVPN